MSHVLHVVLTVRLSMPRCKEGQLQLSHSDHFHKYKENPKFKSNRLYTYDNTFGRDFTAVVPEIVSMATTFSLAVSYL